MSVPVPPSYGITATEHDLLSFFPQAPETPDFDSDWFVRENRYEVASGAMRLVFVLTPSTCDVRMCLSLADQVVYELEALLIRDVVCHCDGDRRTLRLAIGPRETLFLTLDPTITIRHHVGDDL